MARLLKMLALSFAGVTIALSFSTSVRAQDLTGIWQNNDGGTYYIRQLGDVIWWFGENDPKHSWLE
jgi:hypothetical protein